VPLPFLLRDGFQIADRTGRPVLYRYLVESDDLHALTDLLHEAYAPLAAAGMRFVASYQDVETTRQRVGKGETILAVCDDAVIGTVTLATTEATKGSPFYDRPDVASVGQFAVRPADQRRGIGLALMNLCEERARELGVLHLALDTSERADTLIAMYEALGYRFIEHVQWGGLNYRSRVMAKALTL